MTKADLIKDLEGLPDDTSIYIPSMEFPGDLVPALCVQVNSDGSDGSQPEATIIGDD